MASFINPMDIKVRQPKRGGEAEVGVVRLDGWPGLAAPLFLIRYYYQAIARTDIHNL
jgi:hypothetical protein